jgi:hypothetical protein
MDYSSPEFFREILAERRGVRAPAARRPSLGAAGGRPPDLRECGAGRSGRRIGGPLRLQRDSVGAHAHSRLRGLGPRGYRALTKRKRGRRARGGRRLSDDC